jgi:hypothetical protein
MTRFLTEVILMGKRMAPVSGHESNAQMELLISAGVVLARI